MLKLYQGDDRMLENYLITKEGFIISYKNKEPRVLKGQLDRDGYYRVEIRENKENLNRVALAKKYGVSCSCIQHIRRGRTWKDVMPGEFGDKL